MDPCVTSRLLLAALTVLKWDNRAVIVDCGLSENGTRRPGTLSLDDVPGACHRENAFVWIGLYEPTEGEFGDD